MARIALKNRPYSARPSDQGVTDLRRIESRGPKSKIVNLVFLAALLLSSRAAVHADSAHVRILVSGVEVGLKPTAVLHDSEVYAPLEALKSVGAVWEESAEGVRITAADGTICESAVKSLRGAQMIPLLALAGKLGAYAEWDESSRRLNLRPELRRVEFNDGTVLIDLGYPVKFTAREFSEPRRLVIDVPGARWVGPTETRDIGAAELSMLKIGQADEQTARVVLHLGAKTPWRVMCSPPARVISVALAAPPEASPAPPPKAPPKPAKITSVAVVPGEDGRAEIRVSADEYLAPKAAFLTKPYRVCIDFPNAELESPDLAVSGSSPLISEIRVGTISGKVPTVRVTARVGRILAYSVIRAAPNVIATLIRIPDRAGGRLSDKLVVIDPGHGGYQPGARYGEVCEKDLNLKLAKQLAGKLRSMGADVKLTRDGDCYIGLYDRPKLAAEVGADFLISIHCNSNSSPNSMSGTETYYHMQDPSSRALAQAVHSEVVRTARLPDRGAKSDSSLYSNGLAVLRHATVPAVLLEVGYLNHAADRAKLTDAAFQKAVAEGIAKGLLKYVEGEVEPKEESDESGPSAEP